MLIFLHILQKTDKKGKKMKIKELIKKMTLEEKASLCSGADVWHTKAVERLGIPRVMVADGPHGLRKQDDKADHLGVNESIKAVCFPAGCAVAASFDRELLVQMGEALGNECQAEGVSVILGPAVNIKRSPLCGRNFEYFSEDPLLTTELSGALVQGVQSKNVGTSMKHFLANNQETRRMSISAQIDERTLREIYLAAFEGAVRKQKPWTMMCSYNKINGVYAAENKTYLTDVLRDEWGFDGFVMSDWGAVNDRVKDLIAGLELEMPANTGETDDLLVAAVRDGSMEESVLDTAVERILRIIYRFEENRDKEAVFDRDADHELSRKIASESIVLLKNDNVLPLETNVNIAFIGEFAEKPRYQGGGSSHINSHKVTTALEAMAEVGQIQYAQGYHIDNEQPDEQLEKEAIAMAQKVDVAVVFVGLPDAFESEGYDRTHMKMPEAQNRLIAEIAKVQKNVVVVLHNGSPVEMPWVNEVAGIVELYLGGQALGGALVDVLFGKVNPSGKLPETFPKRLEDNPSYLYYPGEKEKAEYREGIFVGYRYYDTKKMEVLFPFGYGLSYTNFEYSNLKVSKEELFDTDTLTVEVDVKNIGNREGKEVVQLYVADTVSTVIRPCKELKEFAKVNLQPGETKTVQFELNKRAFAYYNVEIGDWHVESGEFEILIGKSSRDIELSKKIVVNSTVALPMYYTKDTVIGDLFENERAMELIRPFMKLSLGGGESEEGTTSNEAISNKMIEEMLKYLPLRGLHTFGYEMTFDDLDKLIKQLNEETDTK